MTGPSGSGQVICRQCGTANAAEDQFCGNCGAFLEWTAEPAAGAAGPAAAEPLATIPGAPAGVTGPAAAEARPTSAPSPGGPVASDAGPGASPAGAAASAELVRCPTCGTANVAGKTFCLRCGNKLAGATAATRRPLPSRAELTAAPASTVAPAATGRVAPGKTQQARRSGGGGRSGWLLFAGAGIAVGAIAVVLALSLGSGQAPPPAAASSAPSASVTSSLRPSASVKASPAKSAKPTAKPKASKK